MFRAFVLAVSVGGLAVAAPVPKTPPAPAPKTPANFILGTAVVEDSPGAGKMLKFSYPRPAIASSVNLPPAALKPLTTSMQLAAVKVTTADGKELTGDDLEKALSGVVPAVRSTVAFDPEWKKLFADDVVFIETVRVGVNPVAPGGAIAPVVPGVIRPLVIRRGAIVEPPVEEKKEEPKKEEPKKEEKKEEKK